MASLSDPFYRLRLPDPSPFFLIPAELRVLIYEFVFSNPEPSAERMPLERSSTSLEPLLTCRKLYEEARLCAFACTIHNLNWSRPSSCLRRLHNLDPAQHASIRHVALATTAAGLYDRLQPFRYHIDHDRNHAPHLSLDTLTIVLDVPDTSAPAARERRLQEQLMAFVTIWYLKNVRKVVLLNIMHRERMDEYPSMQGRWTCINDEKPQPASVNGPLIDSCLVENIRWRFELTTFHDYEACKPWNTKR